VDGTFVNIALTFRIDIRSIVPSTLAAEVKVFTTPCVVDEMRKMGEELSGAVLAARRFEMRRCGHSQGSCTAAACLLDLVGTVNPLHLMIATQDKTLRSKLRGIPGVPLLYFSSSVLVLEPHSPVTIATAKSAEKSKTLANSKELTSIKVRAIKSGLLTPAEIQRLEDKPITEDKPQRKKVKEPNPLSCKRKKVKENSRNHPLPQSLTLAKSEKRKNGNDAPAQPTESKSVEGDFLSQGKKRKRKRARSGKQLQNDSQQMPDTNANSPSA
jgi:U3 small nucleolar RNA-associated protein 23